MPKEKKKPSRIKALMNLIKAVQNGSKNEAVYSAHILCGKEVAVVKSAIAKVWKPKKKVVEVEVEEQSVGFRIQIDEESDIIVDSNNEDVKV